MTTKEFEELTGHLPEDMGLEEAIEESEDPYEDIIGTEARRYQPGLWKTYSPMSHGEELVGGHFPSWLPAHCSFSLS